MSCPFQIHTLLNSFTPDCLHRVFSDYNLSPIRIHIPIYDDLCRKDLCSGDHLHLYKRHHHRVTTVCSSIYCINNKIRLSDAVICIIFIDIARYTYILSPWMA
ncbi:hypothetical protein Bca4012_042890 [Brassica carinata]